jgi:hypothetical protein
MLEDSEGGCHYGRVRFRARIDLDLLSQCCVQSCVPWSGVGAVGK